eukprot:scaffold3.g6626.t1
MAGDEADLAVLRAVAARDLPGLQAALACPAPQLEHKGLPALAVAALADFPKAVQPLLDAGARLDARLQSALNSSSTEEEHGALAEQLGLAPTGAAQLRKYIGRGQSGTPLRLAVGLGHFRTACSLAAAGAAMKDMPYGLSSLLEEQGKCADSRAAAEAGLSGVIDTLLHTGRLRDLEVARSVLHGAAVLAFDSWQLEHGNHTPLLQRMLELYLTGELAAEPSDVDGIVHRAARTSDWPTLSAWLAAPQLVHEPLLSTLGALCERFQRGGATSEGGGSMTPGDSEAAERALEALLARDATLVLLRSPKPDRTVDSRRPGQAYHVSNALIDLAMGGRADLLDRMLAAGTKVATQTILQMTGELMDAGYCLAELRRVASADDFRLNLAHRGRLRLIEALVAAGYSGGAAADSWLCTWPEPEMGQQWLAMAARNTQWSTAAHPRFPPSFRAAARALLLVHHRCAQALTSAPEEEREGAQQPSSSWHATEDEEEPVTTEEEREDEEDESAEEDEDDELADESILWRILGGAARQSGLAQRLARFPRLDQWQPPPLEHELAAQLSSQTAALSPRTPRAAAAARPRSARGVLSPAQLLLLRESGGGALAPAQRAHLVAFHRLPVKPCRAVDTMGSRAYIGRFDKSGNLFVAAFQDERKIKVYDVQRGWRLLKSVHARQLRWTFTGARAALHFGEAEGDRNGLWSIRWSGDNPPPSPAPLARRTARQNKTVARAGWHSDDVNAVAYASDDCPHIFFSGSDDHHVCVWDRRLLDGSANPRSLPGDGRYLISNAKDQTVRLWDVRTARAPKDAARLPRRDVPSFRWDYRWMEYPAAGRVVTHPHDGSVQQFRGGHEVRNTLIRAYWSPASTTGQRYILAGSSDGSPCIYDVVTGRPVERLQYHRETVRDVSWHPTLPMIATASFDGSIVTWEPEVAGEAEAVVEEAAAAAEARQPSRGKRTGAAARGGLGVPRPGGDQLGAWW